MSPEVVQAVTEMGGRGTLPPSVDAHSISLSSPSTSALQAAMAAAARRRSKQLKQQMRDANIRENLKFCRKKCKLFKTRCCYKKSFEEQKKCFENKDYEKPHPLDTPIEAETAQ